jgi:alpha-tubulin suppressor-like RCC1 family protein
MRKAGAAILSLILSLSLLSVPASALAVVPDGVKVMEDGPVLPQDDSVKAISVGGSHTLVLTEKGAIFAWGSNARRQLDIPTIPEGEIVTDIAAGMSHSIALTDKGTILLWGSNDFGQTEMPQLPQGEIVEDVSAGDTFSLAKTASGTIIAWGFSANEKKSLTLQEPENDSLTTTDSEYEYFLALSESGEIYTSYLVGLAFGKEQGSLVSPIIPEGIKIASADSSSSHIAGLSTDGRVISWRGEAYEDSSILQQSEKAVKAFAGTNYTAVLTSDGKIILWDWKEERLPDITLPFSEKAKLMADGYDRTVILTEQGRYIEVASGAMAGVPVKKDYRGMATILVSILFVLMLAAGTLKWLKSEKYRDEIYFGLPDTRLGMASFKIAIAVVIYGLLFIMLNILYAGWGENIVLHLVLLPLIWSMYVLPLISIALAAFSIWKDNERSAFVILSVPVCLYFLVVYLIYMIS